MFSFNDAGELKVCLRMLQSLVNSAVEHGGDSGGAYFSNSEQLISSMEEIIYYINQELALKNIPYKVIVIYSGNYLDLENFGLMPYDWLQETKKERILYEKKERIPCEKTNEDINEDINILKLCNIE